MLESIFNKRWLKKLGKIFNNRPVLTKQKFSEEVIEKYNYRLDSIEVIYENIFNYLPKSLEKNIYPDDDLINDYEIDDEDIADLMIDTFKMLGEKFPSVDKQRQFYGKFGDELTVIKMIQFVEFFRSDK